MCGKMGLFGALHYGLDFCTVRGKEYRIKGWPATMGLVSVDPGGPTSCLANECLVSVAYCLFVLFRKFLPHLPSIGFLEILCFHDSH